MVILTCLVLALAGCANHSEMVQQQGMESINVSEKYGKYYRTKLDGLYEMAVVHKDKVYGMQYVADGVQISVQDKLGEEIRCYNLDDIWLIEGMTISDNESIFLWENRETTYALWEINREGIIRCEDNIEIGELGQMPELRTFLRGEDGTFYLWYTTNVQSEQGEEADTWKVYGEVDRIYAIHSDLVTIEQYQASRGSYSAIDAVFLDNNRLKILGREQGEYYTDILFPKEEREGAYTTIVIPSLYGGTVGEYANACSEGIVYVDDNFVHYYDFEKRQDQGLMNLADGGIIENDIIYLGFTGDIIEIVDNHNGNAVSEYSCFQRGEAEQVQLTLGVADLISPLKEIVAEYNRVQDTVRIIPIVYAENYNYDLGFEKMKMDLVQGKAPDLMMVMGLDYEMLAAKGAFANLYDLMGTDRDLFLDSVMRTCEVGNGLYAIPHNFAITTIMGSADVVQGRSGVSMKELMRLLEENGGDSNSVFGFGVEEGVLGTFGSEGIGDFIDWENKTCNFMDEDFLDVLLFAKQYKGKPYEGLCKGLRERDYLLNVVFFGTVEDYCLNKELFGEEVQCLGYPVSDGSGNIVVAGDMLAINAKSAQQKDAWIFLKYYLLNAYSYDNTRFPIVKERLEQVLDAAKNEEEYIDEMGRRNMIPKRSYGEDGYPDINIYKAKDTDIYEIKQLIESVSGRYIYNSTIRKIMDEEAEAYFENQKTAEQVADYIQNRVQLYLNE